MASRSIIIVGGGGHTSALLGVLLAQRAPLAGIITSNPALLGSEVHGVPVLGLEKEYKLDAAKHAIVNGVGNRASAAGSGLKPRAGLYERYAQAGFRIAPVVSAQAILLPAVTQGEGVQIMPGVVVQAGAMLGEDALLNTGALIDHDSVIGPHVHVGPGAVLCGNVSVGALTHIGAGAVVIQDIRIGSNAVIGAGAVVRRDVADGEIFFG
ncbi:MAG: acetyltransferase [Alphaproteobacteria bacterium]